MQKTIKPASLSGTIQAPTSKSYAQRAVAAALLARGESRLHNMELCNDTASAIDVAVRLGALVSLSEGIYTIDGGFAPMSDELNIGESGLATRLFTPIASLSHTPITITGEGSILKRPIDMMQEPLRALGVDVQSNHGLLPITVHGPMKGGTAQADGSLSSQFITGLLMALPLAQQDTTLTVDQLQSIPYIDMTLAVLESFGIEVSHDNYRTFRIRGGQSYRPTNYNVEGDWSGASCLLVAGATAGAVTITNLNPKSAQADRAIIDALRAAGADITIEEELQQITVRRSALRGFEFDATNCPDLFPALAALAASAQGTSRLKGTLRLTHKESNRAQTIATEFARFGISVDISQPDIMTIEGDAAGIFDIEETVSSHNDHRIAMAAATLALRSRQGATIDQAEAVNKSYPTFWQELELLCSEKQ